MLSVATPLNVPLTNHPLIRWSPSYLHEGRKGTGLVIGSMTVRQMSFIQMTIDQKSKFNTLRGHWMSSVAREAYVLIRESQP
jgi:hypothetical protein